MEGADAVYPASASALARGRRVRRAEPRARRKTMPVTFAEIKEVDEENAELAAAQLEDGAERRRRPDVLGERLGVEARRRRAQAHTLRELSPPGAGASAPAELARAGSEPAALHRTPAPADLDT